jgi:predicted O-linked N-acetylglucosamine transferase (SPINDLY family)
MIGRMSDLTLQQAFELAARHHREGRFADAEGLYRQVLAQLPDQPNCLYGLGGVLLQTGRVGEALEVLRRVAALQPGEGLYQHALGTALATAARYDEAALAFERAVALKPDLAEAWNGLGNVYLARSEHWRAIAAYRRALHIQPRFVQAVGNLSSALIDCGNLEEPITYCRQAIELWPESLMFYRLLGWAYRESGRLDDAIECYRKALSLPNAAQVHSDLLFLLHFHDAYDRRRLLEEHAKFNEIYGRPLRSQILPHENDPTQERRLRIGYVAYDLGANPLGRFFLPLLENHAKESFESFCYCDFPRPDEVGQRLRAHGTWRTVGGMSQEQVERIIRDDRIDVLVDLAMHSNNNRMLLFARKPAPVQVTYLAYCSTTGLEAIDYRLTDPHFDPVDGDDSCYSEKSCRLPTCYWCYPAPAGAPAVGPLPAQANGYVTFGCLNEFSKVTTRCLSTWCELLREVPGSRLTLHAKEGAHRQRAIEHATRAGIDPGRIELVGRRNFDIYLAEYNRIDIALDPFPWTGGATSCDALYMGVPLVSLAGDTAVSRGGLSILSNLGLPELVARDAEQYVQIAVGLSRDTARLESLRLSLRDCMLGSPLMDGSRFARDVESAYRQMWRRRCEKCRQ